MVALSNIALLVAIVLVPIVATLDMHTCQNTNEKEV